MSWTYGSAAFSAWHASNLEPLSALGIRFGTWEASPTGLGIRALAIGTVH
jgi:hypothetical protein